MIYSDEKQNAKEELLAKYYAKIEINYVQIYRNEIVPRPTQLEEYPDSIFRREERPRTPDPLPNQKNSTVVEQQPPEEARPLKREDSRGSLKSIAPLKGLLPPIDRKFKYTIVLDLDETLIHFRGKNSREGQFVVRPFARDFILSFGKMYELVVFTAAVKEVFLHSS